ncbi:MAG: protein-L-isoaspartate(D-aspartate) O-methyltransferase [Thermoanaerobaculia bacterium]
MRTPETLRPVTATLLGLLAFPRMAGALDPQAQPPDPFVDLRRDMVDQQIRRRQVRAPNVLRAMEEVPRHRFVPEHQQSSAYVDAPLPIGDGQTISQPYVVALMTELLELEEGSKVLEIGTGSGYQAAVLSRIASEVYSIEIRQGLGEAARSLLEDLGYDNVQVRIGDGYQGWPEAAPFDGIIVTAAPERIPQPLVDQLRLGGKMVIPVGRFLQELLVITRTEDGIQTREVAGVRFVPMIGEVEKPPAE